MAESYNELCATYLQSIWNRLYNRYGNYPNSIEPYTFDVETKTHLPYLRVFVVLNNKKHLYKKIRIYDRMVFNVMGHGNISKSKPLHLEHDLQELISEPLIIV